MSLSPDSFDRLFADKLAQVPEPSYDPAHWDMLEDQLQHLTPQSSNSTPSPSHPAAPATGSWLTGTVAKLGLAAALTGVTAVNGYLYLESRQQPTAHNVAAPRIQPQAPVPTEEALAPTVVATESVAPEVAAPPIRLTTPQRHTAAEAQQASDVGPAPVAVVPSPSAEEHPEPSAALVPAQTASPATEKVTAPQPVEAAQPANTEAAAEQADLMAAADETALNRLSDGSYNIITPNGDGLNDRFELPVPTGSCRLTVFDRAGKVVYVNDHYDNSWDAAGLPAGLYNYVVETSGPKAGKILRSLTVVR